MSINQFHFEHEEAVTRNLRATATRTVSEVARDPSGDLFAHLHELQHFGPTRNHGADREFKRFATVNGAVELGAVKELTGVMDLHDVAIGRSCTRTFGNHLVLEARFGSHDAFGSLVLGEECFACSLVGFGSEAVLLVLFSLASLGKVGQSLENRRIVHQEVSGIFVIAFLESLDEEIEVQVDGIAGHQLETSLVTEMGTESVAVLVLFRHQSSLGLRTLAQLVTSGQSKGESACGNKQFFVHLFLFWLDREKNNKILRQKTNCNSILPKEIRILTTVNI